MNENSTLGKLAAEGSSLSTQRPPHRKAIDIYSNLKENI